MFKIRDKSLRGLVAAWVCMNAGFFIAAYVSDVMQYPNQLPIYIGFALCFAAPHIEKRMVLETRSYEKEPTDISLKYFCYHHGMYRTFFYSRRVLLWS